MSIRRIKLALWLAGGVMAALSILTLVLAAAMPPRQPTAPQTRFIGKGANQSDTAQANVTPQDFRILDLRQSLDGRGPSPAEPQQTGNLTLTGTIVEKGYSQAIFRMPDGRCALKKVGDVIDGAKVLEIRPGSALMLINGQQTTIKVTKVE